MFHFLINAAPQLLYKLRWILLNIWAISAKITVNFLYLEPMLSPIPPPSETCYPWFMFLLSTIYVLVIIKNNIIIKRTFPACFAPEWCLNILWIDQKNTPEWLWISPRTKNLLTVYFYCNHIVTVFNCSHPSGNQTSTFSGPLQS